MAAILLSLASSASFGLADFLGGLSSRRLQVLTVLLVSQVAGFGGIALLIALRADAPPDARFVPLAILASVFATTGLAALYRGLAIGLMSVVAPIAATGAAIPVVASVALGEAPSRLEAAGIALALGGVLLVSRTESAGPAASRFAAGAGLGVVAAVGFGTFFLAFDAASKDDPYWATFAFRTSSLSLLAAAALVRRPPLRVDGRTGLVLALIGVLDVTGNAFFAVATTKGVIGVVAVLTSLYPVVTVALARAFLGERLSSGQALGVVAAFAGVASISLG